MLMMSTAGRVGITGTRLEAAPACCPIARLLFSISCVLSPSSPSSRPHWLAVFRVVVVVVVL